MGTNVALGIIFKKKALDTGLKKRTPRVILFAFFKLREVLHVFCLFFFPFPIPPFTFIFHAGIVQLAKPN